MHADTHIHKGRTRTHTKKTNTYDRSIAKRYSCRWMIWLSRFEILPSSFADENTYISAMELLKRGW